MNTTEESLNHTRTCTICGAGVQVIDGQVQPHRCRIEAS